MNPERALFLLLFFFLTACKPERNSRINDTRQPPQQNTQANDFIGVASMEADGTIVLRLNATTPGGGIGHGYLRYPPSSPQYQDILPHIGPIHPGEEKRVRPWPENSDSQK